MDHHMPEFTAAPVISHIHGSAVEITAYPVIALHLVRKDHGASDRITKRQVDHITLRSLAAHILRDRRCIGVIQQFTGIGDIFFPFLPGNVPEIQYIRLCKNIILPVHNSRKGDPYSLNLLSRDRILFYKTFKDLCNLLKIQVRIGKWLAYPLML